MTQTEIHEDNPDLASAAVGPVVDSFVYHDWNSQDEVVSYLSDEWQEFVGFTGSVGPGFGARPVAIENPYRDPLGDVVPESSASGYPGSRGVTTIEDARTARGLAASVLVPATGLFVTSDNSPQLPDVLCSAMNDWAYDRWHAMDRKLWTSAIVSNQNPTGAAAEIRRVADRGGVAQILLSGNGLGKPFGHPLLRPIFEAAAEVGLPIALHMGGDTAQDTLTQPVAVASPATATEYRVLSVQSLMTHFISMVGQGVFDDFPSLRLMFLGGGVDWLPSYLWRADLEFRAWGSATPWVKRKPSDYLLEHVWIASYQADFSSAQTVRQVMETYPGLAHRICYGSGYPLRDCMTPQTAADYFGVSSDELFRGNAGAYYGRDLRFE